MNSIFKNLFLLCLIFGCSSNPTNADRTVLQKLNGSSYEFTNSIGIVTELPLARKITGQLYCGNTLSQSPTKLAKINIMQGEQIIGSTTSDLVGQYLLLIKVSKQTNYNLQIKAPCGVYKNVIIWENDHLKMNDIFLK